MKTNVYVDGFSFYFGCLHSAHRPHDARYKWLDMAEFLRRAILTECGAFEPAKGSSAP